MMWIPTTASAQKSKFKVADKYYQAYDYTMSGNIYRDIISSAKYSNDTLALRRLAYGQIRLGQYLDAESYLNRLVKLNAASERDLLLLADVLKMQGKYENSLGIYEKIIALNPNNDVAKRHISNPSFAEEIMRDSVIYKIKNSEINSSGSDFGVGFFTKGKLVFTSSRGSNAKEQRLYSRTNQPYLDIFMADISADSTLRNAVAIHKKINTRYHEGTMVYQPGSNTVYFTRNNYLKSTTHKSKDRHLKLGIFIAKYHPDNNEWGDLEAFAYNNPEYSVGHPTLSITGNRLYFVSDKPGGFGGSDIYYCERKDEQWGEPINAGSKINTAGDEMFPFMVSDSVIYFSSNGHPGLGGLDIFYTNPLDDSDVLNVGYPVSTRLDDFAWICYSDETAGYFSSSRTGGKGSDDIYEFRIIPVDTVEVSGTALDLATLQPISSALIRVTADDGTIVEVRTDEKGRYTLKAPYSPALSVEGSKQGYLSGITTAKPNPRSGRLDGVDVKLTKYDAMSTGKVLYAENNAPAIGATIRLVEVLGSDTTSLDAITITKDGNYQFPLFAKKNYSLIVTQEGYARQTASFNTHKIADKVYTRDFKLFKPKVGEVVRLDNIYYDYNSAIIRPDAALELDKLVQIMKDNPTMKIELSSHSDSRGSDDYNLKLSDRRAKSAVEYIISQGIGKDRLYGKGYGELKILNHCKNDVKCSEEEHQYNRRTEFTITAF